ncbi:BTAD domain-containing putative transcriptional regulator [Hamadaea sp. NPDC050747]|uniref:AfsR/SARP family transcriptional regulator n=1 Tax=Hamadaea sp. NPDC050747 TaxID=3155789 RepID=UPI0033EF670E
MRFRVLGAVRAEVDGMPILFNRRRERCLLGLLLLEAGQSLSSERLIDLLWDEPPRHARRNLHGHVARIRAGFSAAGLGNLLVSGPGSGYTLGVDPDDVDAHRFRVLAEQAALLPEPGSRAAALDEALALWGGPVLGADADAGLRDRIGTSWQAMYTTAIEGKHQALIEAGSAEQSLPQLSALTLEHPTWERLTELLMTANYHLGRKADALAAYQRTREWLAEHLGVDPSPGVRQTHQQILRDELPLPAGTAGRRPLTVGRPSAECSLPARPIAFTGRDDEVAALERLLLGDGREGPCAALVTGTAGIGKTALALHVAWRVADRFPDGSHYLDLQGFAAQAPLTAREAMERLLHMLSIEIGWMPNDDADAAGYFRSRLSGRRLLLVIDNASTAQQIRALLPPAGCAIVATSRHRLTELTVDPGIKTLALSTLGPQAAHRLLADASGARAAEQPDAIAEIARLCSYLPLAVRIAAATLSAHPGWDLHEFTAELRADRLGMLTIDDTAVRSAFDTSYIRLEPSAQRMFRLLGLLPSIDLGVPAAAALAGLSPGEARRLLDRLCAAHLIEQHRPRRYSLHDLIRAFAHERAGRDEPSDSASAAVARLYRWYERAAAAAATAAFPQVLRTDTVNTLAAEHDDALDAGAALAWFAAERTTLPVLIAHAERLGERRSAWVLHDAMRPDFRRVSALTAWEQAAAHARRAADADDHRQGLAMAHQSIGDAMNVRSRYDAAVEHHQRAMTIAEDIDWPACAAIAAANAGGDHGDQGSFIQARAFGEHAVDAFLRSERAANVWVVYVQLAFADLEQGRIADATARLEQARQLCPPELQAVILLNLADIHRIQDRLDEAEQFALDGLARLRTHPNRLGEASALAWVCQLWHDRDELARAQDAVTTAEQLLDGGGPPRLQAELHLARARLSHADHATGEYQAALELALAHRLRLHEIRATLGLGRIWASSPGRQMSAEQTLTSALELSRTLGLRPREGEALAELSRLHRHRGAHNVAAEFADAARHLFTDIGYRLALRQLCDQHH